MQDQDLITIGQITTNQGNRGEVRIFPLTDFPTRFEFLDKVFLVKDDKIIEKEIEAVRFHKGKFVVIKFYEINDIGAALDLKDFMVKIPRDMMVPLDENEYYIDQIIDYSVETVQGKKLGKLKEVLSTGGVDIFIVRDENNEYMIPASREIITEIDEDLKLIKVDPVPGLLNL